MNRDCNGDFYTFRGGRFYSCFMDSTVVNADGLSDGNECPQCLRTIYGIENGDVSATAVTTVAVRFLDGRTVEHSLSGVLTEEGARKAAEELCGFEGCSLTRHEHSWGSVIGTDGAEVVVGHNFVAAGGH